MRYSPLPPRVFVISSRLAACCPWEAWGWRGVGTPFFPRVLPRVASVNHSSIPWTVRLPAPGYFSLYISQTITTAQAIAMNLEVSCTASGLEYTVSLSK